MTIKYENLIDKKLDVDLGVFKEKYAMVDEEIRAEELKDLLSMLAIHNNPKEKLAIRRPGTTDYYAELFESFIEDGVIKITGDIIIEPKATEDKKVQYKDLVGKKLTLDKDQALAKGVDQTKIDELSHMIEMHNALGMRNAKSGVTKSVSEPIEYFIADGIIQVGGNVHLEEYNKLVGKKLKLDEVKLTSYIIHELGVNPVELERSYFSDDTRKTKAKISELKIYLKTIIEHHNDNEQGITEVTPDIARSALSNISDLSALYCDIENYLSLGLLWIQEEQASSGLSSIDSLPLVDSDISGNVAETDEVTG